GRRLGIAVTSPPARQTHDYKETRLQYVGGPSKVNKLLENSSPGLSIYTVYIYRYAESQSVSMATIASQASEALNKADYPTAISLYTQALANLPTAVDYYIKRSTAYQRSAKYKEALNDAETAVALAHQRGKRELIGQGQLRRGISCYLLEQYGDAAFCFSLGKKFLDPKEKSVDMWISKVELVLKDTAKVPEDDFRREVTIKEIPDVKIPTAAPAAAPQAVVQEEKQESKPAATPVPSPMGVVTPRDKIRHEWYQTNTHVVFTLYVKGVPKESSSIEIEDQAISINFPLPNSSDFQYYLDPLFAPLILPHRPPPSSAPKSSLN
ncbi:hypothetical protein BGX38DRAFT_1286226, partial [Terfezia claveryi]